MNSFFFTIVFFLFFSQHSYSTFTVILTTMYRTNIIRSWINGSIYLRSLSLVFSLRHFIQMMGPLDLLLDKVFFFFLLMFRSD